MVTFERVGLTSPAFAYPGSEENFANWESLKVEGVNNLGRTKFTVDESISKTWYVFQGSSAPTLWSQRVDFHDFTIEFSLYYTGPR